MDVPAITDSLERVAALGDPAPEVYALLFRTCPDMEALFVRDTNGAVRANMLAEATMAILDYLEGNSYGANLFRIEHVNHENLGVPRDVFALFFRSMRDAYAHILGPDWTPAHAGAWAMLLDRIDHELQAGVDG